MTSWLLYRNPDQFVPEQVEVCCYLWLKTLVYHPNTGTLEITTTPEHNCKDENGDVQYEGNLKIIVRPFGYRILPDKDKSKNVMSFVERLVIDGAAVDPRVRPALTYMLHIPPIKKERVPALPGHFQSLRSLGRRFRLPPGE